MSKKRKASEQADRKPYVTPKLVQVRLEPKEAVLGCDQKEATFCGTLIT